MKTFVVGILITTLSFNSWAQQITEFSYRIKTHSPIRSPDSIVAILEKVSDGKYYFRIVPETQYHHKMRKHICICTPQIYIGDTVVYDTYPNIHYRMRQTYIYRTVRRFKR